MTKTKRTKRSLNKMTDVLSVNHKRVMVLTKSSQNPYILFTPSPTLLWYNEIVERKKSGRFVLT